MGKKRIVAVACILASILMAFAPFAHVRQPAVLAQENSTVITVCGADKLCHRDSEGNLVFCVEAQVNKQSGSATVFDLLGKTTRSGSSRYDPGHSQSALYWTQNRITEAALIDAYFKGADGVCSEDEYKKIQAALWLYTSIQAKYQAQGAGDTSDAILDDIADLKYAVGTNYWTETYRNAGIANPDMRPVVQYIRENRGKYRGRGWLYSKTNQNGDGILSQASARFSLAALENPFSLTIEKKNALVADSSVARSMEGTVFSLQWYNGKYASAADALKKPAEKTFYIATTKDKDGRYTARLDRMHMEAARKLGHTSDNLQYADTGMGLIAPGTIVLSEVKPSAGYMNDTVYSVTGNNAVIASGLKQAIAVCFDAEGTVTFGGTGQIVKGVTGQDHPIRGGISGRKADYLTGSIPEGNAGLKGAEFTVYNANAYSVDSVQSKGKDVPKGEVVAKLITAEDGSFTSDGDHDGKDYTFAAGSYTIRETKAPIDAAGNPVYQLNSTWEGHFSISDNVKDDGKMVPVSGSAGNPSVTPEQPIRGGGAAIKLDHERKTQIAQGDGSLFDAEFSIYNVSRNSVALKDGSVIPSAGYYAADADPEKAKEAVLKEDGKPDEKYLAARISTTAGHQDTMGETRTISVHTENEIVQETVDVNGLAMTGADDLPYGTYLVLETKAPTGYRLNTKWAQIIDVSKQDAYELIQMDDDVIRGDVKGQKIDVERNTNIAQGDATLEGARFGVYNLSKHEVYADQNRDGSLDDALYAPYSEDEVLQEDTQAIPCLILTTDSRGRFTSEDTPLHDLAYGTYLIKEIQPSKGYLLNTSWHQKFTIRQQGEVVDLTSESAPEQVIRGGVYIRKGDALWPDLSDYSAGVSLEGIQFDIKNVSEPANDSSSCDGKTMVQEKLYGRDEIAATVSVQKGTDASGHVYYFATTDTDGDGRDDTLPYGTYTITERVTDKKDDYKYLVNADYADTQREVKTFTIRENGAVVTQDVDGQDLTWVGNANQAVDDINLSDATALGLSIRGNAPVREDLHFNKRYESVNDPGEVAFLLTNLDTGESHIIVTDSMGSFYSDTTHRPHSYHTNANDTLAELAGLKVNENGSIALQHYDFASAPVISAEAMDAEAGTWFGLGQNGSMAAVSDAVAGLTKGHYRIQELKCEQNRNYQPMSSTFYLGRSTIRPFAAYDMGTILNHQISFTSSTEGTIQDGVSKSRFIYAEPHQTFTDTISWDGLPMEEISDGHSMKYDYKVVGEIHYATEYQNHLAGDAFLDADGKPLLVEKKLNKVQESGSVEMKYTLDASKIPGAVLVAYNTLYRKPVNGEGEWEAYVLDQDDTNELQRIYVPGIDTTALNTNQEQKHAIYHGKSAEAEIRTNENLHSESGRGSLNAHMAKAGSRITVTDSVKYQNLLPDHSYVLKGYVVPVDEAWKETGIFRKHKVINTLHGKNSSYGDHRLDADDVIRTVEFTTPEGDGPVSGSCEVKFTFDVDQNLEGKDLVVFEELYTTIADRSDLRLWSRHCDANDAQQQIHIPKLRTQAQDCSTKDHAGVCGDPITLKDVVSYENLIPGEEYWIQGILVNKATGKAILGEDGKPVVSSTSFVPQKKNGEETITFTLSAEAYQGVTVNVYEDLIHGDTGISIAEHMEPTDDRQDVHFPKIHTKAHQQKEIIYDDISLHNLIPGYTYTISGKLMNPDNGEEIVSSGKAVKAMAEVTVDASGRIHAVDEKGQKLQVSDVVFDKKQNAVDATVTVAFRVDYKKLIGTKAVVFEDLLHHGILLTSHADLHDQDQTVTITDTPAQPFEPVKTAIVKTSDDPWKSLYTMLLCTGVTGFIILVFMKRRKERKRIFRKLMEEHRDLAD